MNPWFDGRMLVSGGMNLILFKVIYKKNKNIVKSVTDYNRYKNFFSKHNIDLKNCNILAGTNVAIILDKRNSLIYRLSLNQFGRKWVMSNYQCLQSNLMDHIPKPCGLWVDADVALSAESFVSGTVLKASELTPDIIKRIFDQMYALYIRNVEKVNFDSDAWFNQYNHYINKFNPLWVKYLNRLREGMQENSPLFHGSQREEVVFSRIHGDLTFRNVLVNSEELNFIDFDRSEINFPEMDIFLFYLHHWTYQQSVVDYHTFFSNIIGFISGALNFPGISNFYSICPAFKINQSFRREIAELFLYRMTVMILNASDPGGSYSVELLKKICGDYERIKS